MPSRRLAWDTQSRHLGEQGGAQPKGQALQFEQPLQVGRHLPVHPWQEAIHELDDEHLRAESAPWVTRSASCLRRRPPAP
jgi:hypothetical protein